MRAQPCARAERLALLAALVVVAVLSLLQRPLPGPPSMPLEHLNARRTGYGGTHYAAASALPWRSLRMAPMLYMRGRRDCLIPVPLCAPLPPFDSSFRPPLTATSLVVLHTIVCSTSENDWHKRT